MRENVKVSTNDLLTVLDGEVSNIIKKACACAVDGTKENILKEKDIAGLKRVLDVFRTNYDPFDVYENMEVTGNDSEGNGS